MAQVTVTIAGKTYRMACDDGQEEHLFGLARRLDETVDQLRGVFGEIGDQRLTVMSAITVLDRLSEAERRLDALAAEADAARAERDQLLDQQAALEARVAETLLTTAGRIEALAEKLAPGKTTG
ncbi:cell division protein ZapA [Chthonobacter rhizosphaerae]|uniref:cell division protein ZapA n=1 Tax=Chthonobacter rhizosphaerae TaxID=2735553 RepID=UPI0015EF6DB4|nr:cell division protein ZapA [Chthonobacter rhizosphaerae]